MKKLLILLVLLPGIALAADNIDVTSGTGNTVAFDDISGVKHQRVKVVLGADGTSDGDVSSANPMPVVITAGTAGIGKLTANSGVDIGDVDVKSLPALATGTNVIGKVKITDGTDDVAVTAGGLLQVDIAGNTAAVGGGTEYTEGDTDATITGKAMLWEDTGDTLRAVSAAKPLPVSDAGGALTVDGTVAATQSGTWNVTNISGTVSLPTGAATETTLSSIDGKIAACNTGAVTVSAALPAGTNAIGKLSANSGVDIGDVDVTSLPAITLSDTSCTAFRDAALSNTAVAVKAAGGKVKRYYIFNPDTAVCMLQVYNVAAASVTPGTTTPAMTIPLPAGAAANDSSIEGWNFDTAIAVAATTTATGDTACGADLIVNLCYD
jgi:hypothetical protein